ELAADGLVGGRLGGEGIGEEGEGADVLPRGRPAPDEARTRRRVVRGEVRVVLGAAGRPEQLGGRPQPFVRAVAVAVLAGLDAAAVLEDHTRMGREPSPRTL